MYGLAFTNPTMKVYAERKDAGKVLNVLMHAGARRESITPLRTHEPPRNSGEGAAVDGPTPLAGGDESHRAG